MLKRSKPTNESIEFKPRPPWFQKISVDSPRSQASDGQEWQSKLSEKLRAMQPEKPPEFIPEARSAHFAFTLKPLDSLVGAGQYPAIHAVPAVETPEAYAPAEPEFSPDPQVEQRGEEYRYTLVEKPTPMPITTEYELAHSTVAYQLGDEFNLEELFDGYAKTAPESWSPPQETIEALVGEFDSVPFVVEAKSEPKIEPVKTAVQPVSRRESFAQKVANIFVEPKSEPTPTQPQVIAATLSGERASITPVLQVNKQRELMFPLLKTQKRALEFANPAEAQQVIEKLEETLEQFSIEGHVVGIQRGPIITRYELKMAAGIKVNRILALTDELAMALEAMRVRIEAPIPGRSTVGIEIPNKQRVKVLLGDILNDAGYKEFGGELPLPLGRDIAGNLLLEDLTRMPHLLIAGATGSGKSVAVNSFISSLILHKTPEEVRFLLVDPKLVELSAYNDIPHLLHPVITEPNKAILALNWAVEEMERRYEDLADMRSRDIRSFNVKVRELKGKSEYPIMPYIVVLIDELGDLMMVAGKEVESSIIRLAQKARAVGIHLILATQRPSVDVITALIKANCPARIALQVAQKTDSRTILDGNGAEQLLGQGDMLFKHPSKAMLIRAQVPLIEDNEVEDVVNYAKKLAKPVYITLEDPKGKMGELEEGDEELFGEAWQIIVESQKASASYLQRRLRIGYNKAARLIEAFEARGMIGPQIGSKPREIIGGTGQGVDRPTL